MVEPATRDAIASATPGMGRVIWEGVSVELMQISVINEQPVLWIARAHLMLFADLEAGEQIAVNFWSDGVEYRFVSRTTVPRIGVPPVETHGNVFIRIAVEMPKQTKERGERPRRHSTSGTPNTDHDILAGMLIAFAVMAMIAIILAAFLPLVGIRIL